MPFLWIYLGNRQFYINMVATDRILKSLDDDCLYEILAQSCSSIKDLLEIASTCKTFRRIARQIFTAEFKQNNHYNDMGDWSTAQLEEYFRHFGEFCETFDTKIFNKPKAVLQLLTIYCANLVNLRCCNLDATEFDLLYELCAKLVQLEYYCGKFEGAHLFDESSPLQKLTLYDCEAELPKRHLFQLQHVNLKSVIISSQNIARFCQLNQQLVQLELDCVTLSDNRSKGRTEPLMNLEELSYTGFSKYLIFYPSFENLIKLRKLQLHGPDSRVYRMLNALHRANAPLESLILRYIDLDTGIINTICQLKSIKQLKLEEGISSRGFECQNVIQLINNLPQLEDIHCKSKKIKMRDIRNVLQKSYQLNSAWFVITAFDYEREYSNIGAISTLANNLNIYVKIEIMSDKSVSDKFYIFDASFRTHLDMTNNFYIHFFVLFVERCHI